MEKIAKITITVDGKVIQELEATDFMVIALNGTELGMHGFYPNSTGLIEHAFWHGKIAPMVKQLVKQETERPRIPTLVIPR